MLGVALFAAGFLVLFGLTTVVPTFPPGEIVYPYLGISNITSPISGLSDAVFVYGVINGLFWGLIFVIIYRVSGGASRGRIALPPRPPVYAEAPATTSPYVPPKTYAPKPMRRVRKRRTQTPLDHKVVAIEGIGPVYGKRLRRSGIWTVDDLLREGSDRSGRHALAREVGVSTSTVLRWVSRADFFRIAGIGKQYSSLLESAGVNSVSDLSRRNPIALYERLKTTNWRKHLVRRTPSYSMVEEWVENAKSLRPMVTH